MEARKKKLCIALGTALALALTSASAARCSSVQDERQQQAAEQQAAGQQAAGQAQAGERAWEEMSPEEQEAQTERELAELAERKEAARAEGQRLVEREEREAAKAEAEAKAASADAVLLSDTASLERAGVPEKAARAIAGGLDGLCEKRKAVPYGYTRAADVAVDGERCSVEFDAEKTLKGGSKAVRMRAVWDGRKLKVEKAGEKGGRR